MYRKRINIPTHTTTETAVYVTVPSFDAIDTTKFQSDCGDLRFTKTNGELLKYYVVDCDATATVHVLFDSLPAGASDYFMYYGNATASDGFENADFPIAATGLGSQALASEQTTPGPVAEWSFDEGQGQTVQDSTSSNNDGTLGATSGSSTDDPTWLTEDQCVSGKCLRFDGTDDYVGLSSSTSLKPTSTTISTWFKTSSSSSMRLYRSRTSGLHISMSSGSVSFIVSLSGSGNESIASASTYNDNKWHFVSATYDNNIGVFSLFVDGQLIGSDTGSGNINYGNGFAIGRDGDYSANYFNGSIDEVKIYPYARSAAQVKVDYNLGAGVLAGRSNSAASSGQVLPNASVYYALDEQQGSTANTSVPNSTNGTISNATWKTKTNCKINGCLSFDGTGDVITIATASDSIVDFNASEQFSSSAWVYVTTMPGSGEQDAVIAKWDQTSSQRGYRLYVENDDADTTGNFEVEIYDESADQTIRASAANDSVALNTWYHIAFTFNGGTTGTAADLKLSVNGKQVASNAANASFLGLDDVTADFTIGEYDTTDVVATNTGFTGYIDEVNVYSALLSTDQLQQDVNAGASLNMGVTALSEATQLSDGEGAPPVAYWSFDEKRYNTCNGGSNDVCDRSGNGNDGSITNNAAKWISGKIGSAVEMNNDVSYITIADPSSGVLDFGDGQDFTITGWFKRTDETLERGLFDKKNSYNATDAGYAVRFFDGNDRLTFYMSDGTDQYIMVSVTAFTQPNWHHFVIVVDRDSITNSGIYVNGIKEAITTGGTLTDVNSLANSQSLYLGRSASNGTTFKGALDEFKIYNYARTPAQIAYDYNRGAPIAHWQLDECEGSTIYDASGNNNHGTLTITATGGNTNGIGTCNTSTSAWGSGASGKYNSSLYFDGDGDGIDVTNSSTINLSADLTLSAWVKTNNAGTFGIVGKSAASNESTPYSLYLLGGDPRFLLGNGASYSIVSSVANGGSTINNNSWHHLVGTIQGSTMTLYVNAKSVGTTSFSGTRQTNTNVLYLGKYARSTTPYSFSGQIDDVRIYNYSLSADQVKKLFNENSGARFAPSQGSAP